MEMLCLMRLSKTLFSPQISCRLVVLQTEMLADVKVVVSVWFCVLNIQLIFSHVSLSSVAVQLETACCQPPAGEDETST